MLPEDHERLAWAVLEFAASKGWDTLEAKTLAHMTALSATAIAPYLSQPCRLMKLLVAAITRRATANVGVEDNTRDALFALLMARFDVLQEYRAAIIAMPSWLRSRPAAALALAASLPSQLHATLALAGIQPITPLQIINISAVYAQTLRIWRQDNTPDLSQTMAMLDRQLGYI
jgi:ubiquinone biosynthesis protein COQ9